MFSANRKENEQTNSTSITNIPSFQIGLHDYVPITIQEKIGISMICQHPPQPVGLHYLTRDAAILIFLM